MLYSIKDREDLENLNKLASLQDQVEAVRLQDNLGKQKFPEDMKKLFEPVTKTFKNVSEYVTKSMMIISKENRKNIEASPQTKRFLIIIQICNLFQKQIQTMFSNLLNVIFN